MNILAIFPSNMRKFGGALNANFGSIASGTLNAFFFFFFYGGKRFVRYAIVGLRLMVM